MGSVENKHKKLQGQRRRKAAIERTKKAGLQHNENIMDAKWQYQSYSTAGASTSNEGVRYFPGFTSKATARLDCWSRAGSWHKMDTAKNWKAEREQTQHNTKVAWKSANQSGMKKSKLPAEKPESIMNYIRKCEQEKGTQEYRVSEEQANRQERQERIRQKY